MSALPITNSPNCPDRKLPNNPHSLLIPVVLALPSECYPLCAAAGTVVCARLAPRDGFFSPLSAQKSSWFHIGFLPPTAISPVSADSSTETQVNRKSCGLPPEEAVTPLPSNLGDLQRAVSPRMHGVYSPGRDPKHEAVGRTCSHIPYCAHRRRLCFGNFSEGREDVRECPGATRVQGMTRGWPS